MVMVLQPSEPRITIAGVDRLTRPAADLRGPAGLTLFQDLHIISTVTKGDTASHHTGTGYRHRGVCVCVCGAASIAEDLDGRVDT